MAGIWGSFTMKCKLNRLSASLVLAALTSQAFAGGFQIQEQNVTNLGLAYSGTAALAEDATTGFYNPAGLSRICDSQVVLSGVLITGNFKFTATEVTPSIPPILGGEQMAVGEDNPARMVGVPTLSVAKRIDDRWVMAFNVNSPFGLRTVYDGNGIARYIANESQLITLNLSPSIAYQPSSCWSIGGGMDFEYLEANLNSYTGNGFSGQDGWVRNEADGWGYSWHVGVLWEPVPTTRLGVNYRAKVNVGTKGVAELYTGPSFAVIPTNNPPIYSVQTVESYIVLPETATFSFYQELGAFNANWSCLALTGDIAWTNWSRFHTLRLRYSPGFEYIPGLDGQGIDSDTWANFKDARRYALGLIYNRNANWLFQCGIAYDETPTRDQYRSARIPDDNRYWLAVGAAFMPTSCWRFDLGYAHLFFERPSINETAPYAAYTTTPISSATLAGSYKPYANLVGIQMRYDFV